MAPAAFFLASFGIGILLVAWLDPKRKISAWCATTFALALGMVAAGFLALGFSVGFENSGVGAGAGIVSAFFLIALNLRMLAKALLDFKERWRAQYARFRNHPGSEIGSALGIAFLVLLLAIVGIQAMRWNSQGAAQASFMGWGDGAYHLDTIRYLATADPFVLQESLAAGARLRYPLAVEFLSALLMRLGSPIAFAWHAPTIIGAIALASALWEAGFIFLRRRALAFSFAFLALVGSGLGFAWFARDVAKDAPAAGWIPALVQNFQNPEFEYTHLDVRTGGKTEAQQSDANIAWIVPLVSFFAHQRTFVLGAALGVLFLAGLLLYQDSETKWRWFALLGFLPLVHTHTFLALGAFALVWFLYRRAWDGWNRPGERREFFVGAAAGIAVALPQVWYIVSTPGASGIGFVPWFGWTMCTHARSWLLCDPGVAAIDTNAVWFWLKNFGLIFAGWVFASFWAWKQRHDLRVFVIASWVLFAIGNLVKLQPWEFDNNKFLFWWWIMAILIALNLFEEKAKLPDARFANYDLRKNFLNPKFLFVNLMLVVFVFFGSFSGALDVWSRVKYGFRIVPGVMHFGYSGVAEETVAQWIRQNTKPNDAFLTSSSPSQFVPMLTGRPIYLGYPGWLWSHGYNALVQERTAAIREFLRAGATDRLCQAGVGLWLADNDFLREYSADKNVNPAPWDATRSLFSYQDGARSWDIRKINCR